MTDQPSKRIHRPRKQTPKQVATEQAIRDRFQREKPSLEKLIDSGDVSEVSTMGKRVGGRITDL